MFFPIIVIISYALDMLHQFNDYQHPGVFDLLRKCSTYTDISTSNHFLSKQLNVYTVQDHKLNTNNNPPTPFPHALLRNTFTTNNG